MVKLEFIILSVVALVVVVVWTAVVFFSAHDVRDCTVTEKQQTVEVTSTDDSTTSEVVYYIYTDECGVLQLRQQPFLGVWSAAEMYGRLTVGQTYEIETRGPRIQWAGWFPQIVRVA